MRRRLWWSWDACKSSDKTQGELEASFAACGAGLASPGAAPTLRSTPTTLQSGPVSVLDSFVSRLAAAAEKRGKLHHSQCSSQCSQSIQCIHPVHPVQPACAPSLPANSSHGSQLNQGTWPRSSLQANGNAMPWKPWKDSDSPSVHRPWQMPFAHDAAFPPSPTTHSHHLGTVSSEKPWRTSIVMREVMPNVYRRSAHSPIHTKARRTRGSLPRQIRRIWIIPGALLALAHSRNAPSSCPNPACRWIMIGWGHR